MQRPKEVKVAVGAYVSLSLSSSLLRSKRILEASKLSMMIEAVYILYYPINYYENQRP